MRDREGGGCSTRAFDSCSSGYEHSSNDGATIPFRQGESFFTSKGSHGWVCWRSLFPSSFASAGLMLLALFVSRCDRYRGFDVAGASGILLLQSL
jgi:hypothetical protein